MNKNAEDFDEARWRRLADADAAEEPLSEAEREFLAAFVPRSPGAKAEAQLYSALTRLGEDDWQDEEAANSPLVDATVQHVLAARPRATSAAPGAAPVPARRRWTVLGLVAAAAAAAVIMVWLGPSSRERVPEQARLTGAGEGSGPTTPARPPFEPTPAERIAVERTPPAPTTAEPTTAEPAPTSVGLRVASGSLRDADGRVLVASAPVRGAVEVDAERGCVELQAVTACFQRGARLEVDDAGRELTVLEGVGTIDVPAPVDAGVIVVRIAGERYVLSSPVTIETTAYDVGRARVEVTEGRVELRDGEGRVQVLAAGAVRGRTRAPQPPPPDAKTLLAKARASRSARDREAAIAHYESLLRHHPEHAASHAAMVSLGDLYLDTHQPAAALAWFQRYLDEGGGSLAQEASIGRIKALRALGRDAQLRQAVASFRERYPSSRYLDQLDKPSP